MNKLRWLSRGPYFDRQILISYREENGCSMQEARNAFKPDPPVLQQFIYGEGWVDVPYVHELKEPRG